MEYTIADVALTASVTSRTLRHYDRIGLLVPARIGPNGYRYYDDDSLVRLQRVLLLRELGIGLGDIRTLIDGQRDEAEALATHLDLLRVERERVERQIRAVQHTISYLQRGEPIVAGNMFEGFDHSVHRDEVERRWGRQAYADSAGWWENLGDEGRELLRSDTDALNETWQDAARRALPVDGDEAQRVAERHVRWLENATGGHQVGAGYLTGLGDMYVADERFWPNYGGAAGAAYVRDVLRVYAERVLA